MGILTRCAAFLLLLGCSGSSESDVSARLAGPVCPARMAHLPELGVCIDRFEAALEGEGRSAVARSAEGRLPAQEISWADAQRACERAGYRLCERDEWMLACAGTTGEGGRAFPYGDTYEQDRCNSAGNGTDVGERSLAVGGAFERCVTPEGVHDLSGNIGEWLATSDESGMLRELRGGSYANYEKPAHCVTTPLAFQPPEDAWTGLGFRCCTDAR